MIPMLMHFYSMSRWEVLDLTMGQFVNLYNQVGEIAKMYGVKL